MKLIFAVCSFIEASRAVLLKDNVFVQNANKDVSEAQKKMFRIMKMGEEPSIQIYDMNHGYDIDQWRDSLSDMKLNMQQQDIRLKMSLRPPEATNLQLGEAEFTLND